MDATKVSAEEDPTSWSSFRRLWASSATSNLSDGVLRTAVPLLAVALTRDPLLIAGLTVAQYLPWLLLTLWSGVVTDRYDRRTLLVIGNGVRAIAIAGFAVALFAGAQSIWLLYVAVFLVGACETAVDNASLVALPRLVGKNNLDRANGRIVATQSVVDRLVGPPLGAGLFALSAVAALVTGSALFAVAAIAAALLPSLRPRARDASAAHNSFHHELTEGLRFFWRTKVLREAAFVSANINFWGTATGAVLILLLTDQYGLDPIGYGIVLSIGAIGGIVGALLSARIIRLIGPGTVLALVGFVEAINFAALGTFTIPLIATAALGLGAFMATSSQVVVSSLRQAAIPDHILGRVTSAYRLIVLGVVPLGAATGGVIATMFQIDTVYYVSAAGMLAGAILSLVRLPNGTIRSAMEGHLQQIRPDQNRIPHHHNTHSVTVATTARTQGSPCGRSMPAWTGMRGRLTCLAALVGFASSRRSPERMRRAASILQWFWLWHSTASRPRHA